MTAAEKPTLPPFSGDSPTCPKCGDSAATTTYLSFGECRHGSGIVVGYEVNERLHRECDRCGFEWDEATVEQRPAAAEETPCP